MAGYALEVDHVTKRFARHRNRATSIKGLLTGGRRGGGNDFTALDDVSFQVPRGEVFGIIGHNGSGKSTMLKCIAGILQPNVGKVVVHDRMSALLELGAGFHPELTGRENVFLNAALLGMGRREIAAKYDEIVDFSGLDPSFLDEPVKTYSSGMYVRLAFSIAINVEPDLLVIDEILAVGDLDFQRKCKERFIAFRNSGRTTVIVTHDMESVTTMCDRAVWLDHGRLLSAGQPSDVVDGYTESMSGTTTRLSELGTFREGSGEVQFTAVRMIEPADHDGAPRRPRTGDTIVLELDYHATEPIADLNVALTLTNAGGVIVSHPSTNASDVALDTPAGDGTVRVTMSDVPLLPGRWKLNILAADRRGQVLYDHVHEAITFDVLTGTSNENQGLFTLRPRWEQVR